MSVVGIAPGVVTLVVIALGAPAKGALLDDADAFLNAMRAGHHDAAYGRLTAERRAVVSAAQFEALLAARPELAGWRERRFAKLVMLGDVSARVTCVLEAEAGKQVLTIGSRRVGQHWEVDAL